MMYFAYGSNCNPAIMKRKGVEWTSRQRAALPGYRLLFNKKALRERIPDDIGFANIDEDPERRVEGILYDISDEDVGRLDASERSPEHYERIEVTVETESGPRPCFTYRARPDKTAPHLKPSRNYLNHILAARDFLSWQYLDALEKSQTYEGPCAVCHTVGEVIFLREGDRIHMLCQPCREARLVWGDARGRPLSVAEAESVMTNIVRPGAGFNSVRDLIREAIEARVLDP
jgi:gamma-glutamylcyclotransferase